MKVQPIHHSKILKKGLEFAAQNGALFKATAALGFSVLRPAVILATPNTDKENREYASAKSIVSTAVGYLIMLFASMPVSDAIKKIDESPLKYLKKQTIKTLQGKENTLGASKKYSFATQLFKLGTDLIVAAPKSIITCALIPLVMNKLFSRKGSNTNVPDNTEKTPKNTRLPNFTGIYNSGIETIAEKFGKTIDTKFIQNMAEKFHDTRFEQHLISLSDIVATIAFMHQTSSSDRIKENRKKALMYNAAISTGLSVAGGYLIDSATKKSTEKFIENFKKANINDPKLSKYIEGIRVAKPVFILGTMYYLIIPLISTFTADKFGKNNKIS